MTNVLNKSLQIDEDSVMLNMELLIYNSMQNMLLHFSFRNFAKSNYRTQNSTVDIFNNIIFINTNIVNIKRKVKFQNYDSTLFYGLQYSIH